MKIAISKKLAVVNSASYVVSRVLQASVLVWLQQYLLRRISPAEYSLLPVLAAVMVFTPILTTMLTSGISRYVTEAYARSDAERVGQIASTMFPILLVTGALVLAVGLVFAWHVDQVLTIAPEYAGEARLMMAIMMFSFSVRLPMAFFGCGFHVRQKYVLRNMIELSTQFLSIGILFVLLYTRGPRVLWVVIASSTGHLTDSIIVSITSRKLVPELKIRLRQFRWNVARELISFGTWSFVGQVGMMIRKAADPIILNKLTTAADVTSFHIGSMADRHLQPLIGEVFWPLMPVLTAMHATGEKERLRYTYLRLNRMALWVSMMAAMPLMIYASEFFQLYLSERFGLYVSAPLVMILLFLPYPAFWASSMLWYVAQASGRIRLFASIKFAVQLASVGLTFFFVGYWRMGAIGSALAGALALCVGCLAGFWPLGLRLLDIRLGRFLAQTILPGLAPALIGGVVWFLMGRIVPPDTWGRLALCIAAGSIAYLAGIALCLQPADRADLGRIGIRFFRKGSKAKA
jgi:O-antigen/teichoic acid export membrane protein